MTRRIRIWSLNHSDVTAALARGAQLVLQHQRCDRRFRARFFRHWARWLAHKRTFVDFEGLQEVHARTRTASATLRGITARHDSSRSVSRLTRGGLQEVRTRATTRVLFLNVPVQWREGGREGGRDCCLTAGSR